MSRFETEYRKLNPDQKTAVDTIYGPVMVVAGPGTGKTQLLSMRVANILRVTDVLPRNILCLTFTESAATAMRERLLELIGIDAHKVAIHTFHSFGVEVINQYPHYFYNGARFTPSDEVLQIEVIREILQRLPHDNPLTSTMNDRFIYIRPIAQAIGYLKKAGLNANELRDILNNNETAIQQVEPLLQEAFDVARFSKSHLPRLRNVLDNIPSSTEAELPEPFVPFLDVLRNSLERAVVEAEEAGTTKPVTAWKDAWMQKDDKKQYILKDRSRNERLFALADVYERYQTELLRRERYDFADMVLQVLNALEEYLELRYALQEQYQFLLVDEFQDTNDAQLRILYALADNPVHEGNPDLMVVGDDDQAIYKFQGAEVNNILYFRDTYPQLQTTTLQENYRSRQDILDMAQSVISQGETRLENKIEEVNKTQHAASPPETGRITLKQLETPVHEYAWIAREVQQCIENGTSPRHIAVIGRQHTFLEALMPHLRAAGIPVVYERRQNVLEEYHIAQLIEMAYTIHYLSQGEMELANEYVSRVLSFPFWNIDPVTVWSLSRQAYENRKPWLDVMLENGTPHLKKIAHFLLECAQQAVSEPLEYVLDRLIGSREGQSFTSPYRGYHFSEARFQDNRGEYIAFLSALRLLRNKLRDYRRKEVTYLGDLIEFVELHAENDMPIVDETPFVSSDDAVQVMTAHKAKGQEYDTVFIINAQESVWAGSGGRQQLPFPKNLPITPAGDAFDDQLRLFFVALTRAKSTVYITGHAHDSNGKPSVLMPFIDHSKFEFSSIRPQGVERALEHSWQSYHPLPRSSDTQAVLKPILDEYQLNVTHFLKFLDIAWAGPHAFLLESLLRFPQAPTASAAYGTAIHITVWEIYRYISQQRSLDVATVQEIFENTLAEQRLQTQEYEKYLKRGKQELARYFQKQYPEFDPGHVIERDFKKQGAAINDARLSGKIDKIVIHDNKVCDVHDFKTGKPLTSWNKNSGNEALKAWRYKTQLIFYKILLERSRNWSDYRVDRGVLEFVQPHRDDIILLEHTLEDGEVDRVARLIQAVWRRIQNLDFPDVEKYEPNISGIRQFEDDLLTEQGTH